VQRGAVATGYRGGHSSSKSTIKSAASVGDDPTAVRAGGIRLRTIQFAVSIQHILSGSTAPSTFSVGSVVLIEVVGKKYNTDFFPDLATRSSASQLIHGISTY